MNRSRLSGWAVVLALAIATWPTPVAAEETDTITITGTFKMNAFWGTDADLAGVYANGAEHTWTATLHGVTHEHSGDGYTWARTLVSATSSELQFSGPDAATLNAVVSDRLGGPAYLYLDNYQGATISDWWLSFGSADPDAGVSFYMGDGSYAYVGFPADTDGYPVLPSQLVTTESTIYVAGGASGLVSYYDVLDVTGDIGTPIPPTMSIGGYTFIQEGDRGSTQVTLWVTLSNASDQTVTVDYRTMDGTAISVGGRGKKADYVAASGTLVFQPRQTLKPIVVSINGDHAREAHETFSVELLNAVGVPVEQAVATVTILNDD